MINDVQTTDTKAYILIKTRQDVKEVVIDAIDWAQVETLQRLVLYKDPKGREFARAGKEDNQVLLHRHLFEVPKGYKLDWKSGDTLDLRRENLRLVDRHEVEAPEAISQQVFGTLPQPAERGRDVLPADSGTPLTALDFSQVELRVFSQLAKKKSEVRGVYFHKQAKLWTASAFYEKKRYSLGYFKTEDEAINEVTIFRAEGPNSTKLKRNQRKGN